MSRNEIRTTLIVGVILGILLLTAVYIRDNRNNITLSSNLQNSSTLSSSAGVLLTPTPTPYQKPVVSPTPGTELLAIPFQYMEPQEALLLYDDQRPTSFSVNFCKLITFYGLKCTIQVINDQRPLLGSMLLDQNGNPFKLIGLDANLFYPQYDAMSIRALAILNEAVRQNGSNLYIGKLDPTMPSIRFTYLTSETVQGVAAVADSSKDWYVSPDHSAITQELTGLSIISSQMALPDSYAISYVESPDVSVLVSAKDNADQTYPVFLQWKPSTITSSGSIFFDSGEDGQSLDTIPFRDLYYSAASFSQIIPIMMVIKYTYQDEIWHSKHHFANLTIDESILIEPDQNVNYTYLLEMMRQHSFHTSVAVIPANWEQADPNIIAMFMANPEYYSTVQYGNSGEGYEFYRYSIENVGLESNILVPTKSLEEQQRAILEGMSRMNMLESLTGLRSEPIMILPGGISPEDTLHFLKVNRFLAVSSLQDTPLDSERPDKWDYGMYPAVTDYAGFANMIRRIPDSSSVYQPYYLASILDLFVDKPALFSTFPYGRSMFASSMEAFDPLADQLNGLSGEIVWDSLGYIARHLSLERKNNDGSVSARMFTSELIVENDQNSEQITYLTKENMEPGDAIKVLVNGHEFPFQINDGILSLGVKIPAKTTASIVIDYGPTD